MEQHVAIPEAESAARAGDTRGSGRNRAVLVVGAGRSGTSALTRGLFIEPNLNQVKAAHKIGADYVELHTGPYANAKRLKEEQTELEAVAQAAKLAYKLGIGVNAGHGLTYRNVKRLTQIAEIVEFNIGHSIIARAVLVGLERAVREMKELVTEAGHATRS